MDELGLVLNMINGAVLYGPLFGKHWMEELNLSQADIEGDQSWKPYGVAVLNSFLMSFVLANVIQWAGVTMLYGGMLVELVAWLRFPVFPSG